MNWPRFGARPAPPAEPPRIVVDTPGPEFEPRPPGYAFNFPDTECDGWSTTAGLTLRCASVRGAAHRYRGKPRQDAARAAAHQDTGTIAFAVADGVSSATESEVGAQMACRAALEKILELLAQDIPPHTRYLDVVTHTANRLIELARSRIGTPTLTDVAGLYATTLVAGTVRPDPDGPVVELFRIGDSNAWVLDRSCGAYQVLFPAETDEDAEIVTGAVTPLPLAPDTQEETAWRLGPDAVLLVGTDGFGDPLGDGDGQVGAMFAHHLAEPPSPLWFAHVLDFSRETFDDDRTLLAVWPR